MIIGGDIISVLQEGKNYAIYLVGLEKFPLYIKIESHGASSFESYTDKERQTLGYQFVKFFLIAPISSDFEVRYQELFGHKFPQEGIIAKCDGPQAQHIDGDMETGSYSGVPFRNQDPTVYAVGVYHGNDKELKNNLGLLHSANQTDAHDILKRVPQAVRSIHF
ncbi:MAG: hypothetical protein HHAS10_11160 [Candidatus Altimarinota bacterium]